MNQTLRNRIWVGTTLVLLSMYAVLSASGARTAADQLAQAEADLAEVSTKLARIQRLQRAPSVAALEIESPSEIANRVEAARQSARLPQSALLKEQPLAPVRIDRSDFELRATRIELAAATLPQIVAFCEALRDESTGTVVRDIMLDEPQNASAAVGGEKWEAQLVLTQMIFSPKSR